MNKLIKTFTLSLIALSSFFFASCNLNSFLASESDNNSQPHYVTITGTIKNGDALPAEFTSDSSSNENSSAANLSKTAAPEIPSGLTYFAEATHEGLASPVTGTVSDDKKSFTIQLEATATPVTWTITCGAKNNGELVLIDTFEKTISLSDVIFNHEFNVKPLTNSTGSVCLGVDYVADKINKIEVSCLSSNKNEWISSVEFPYSNGFLNIKTKYGKQLPSGEYLIRLDFKKDNTLVYSLDQAVYVFDGFTTNKWFMTDSKRISEVQNADNKNSLKITGNDIEQFTDTTFYVDASNTNPTGNLPPKGSYLNPFTTLKEAVDKCNSDTIHTDATYTIFINGTVKEADTVEITKNTAIKALNSSATIERDTDAAIPLTILKISDSTKPQVSISDIIIDGKYTTESTLPNQGGGIDNRGGTLTLNNCTIKNCKALSYGGGIYNYKGTLTLSNTTVTNCKANNEGGGICSTGAEANDNQLFIKNSSKIQNNEANSGGGIYLRYSKAQLDATSYIGSSDTVDSAAKKETGMYSNKARFGGGIYIGGAADFTNNGKIIYNIANEGTTSLGGGVYVDAQGKYKSSATSSVSYNSSVSGGGLFTNSQNVIDIGGIITSNYAESFGGGIYSKSALSLGNVLIGSTTVGQNAVSSACTGSNYSNYAGDAGGGIYTTGYITSNADTKIWYNYANSDGGGIYLSGSGGQAATVIDGTIYYNNAGGTTELTTKGFGGGICIKREDGNSQVTTISANVSGNCSANFGGGIYYSATTKPLTITGTIGECTVLSSKSDAGLKETESASSDNCSNKSKYGGGIYSDGNATINLTGTVNYNYATTEGGGIYTFANNSNTNKLNLTDSAKVSYNKSASDAGNGVYCNGKCTLTITGNAFINSNNTVRFNTLSDTEGEGSVISTLSSTQAKNIATISLDPECPSDVIITSGSQCQSQISFVQPTDKDGKLTDYYYLVYNSPYCKLKKLSSNWDVSKAVFVQSEGEINSAKTNFILNNISLTKSIIPENNFVITTIPGKTVKLTLDADIPIINQVTATKDKPLTINIGSANGGNLTFDLNNKTPSAGSGYFDLRGTYNSPTSKQNQMINVNFTNVYIMNGKNKSGIYTKYGKLKLKNCTINNIKLTGWVYGGGICVDDYSSELWLSDTNITNCSAKGYGGGIYCQGKVYTIGNTSIKNCTAGKNGGGIFTIGAIYYGTRNFCSKNNLDSSTNGDSYQLAAAQCYYCLSINFDDETTMSRTEDYDKTKHNNKYPKNGASDYAPTYNMEAGSF